LFIGLETNSGVNHSGSCRNGKKDYFADMMEIVDLHSIELLNDKLIEIQAEV
jgi:hypothetical protein